MKDVTKKFYYDDIWKQIATDPGYNLGRRELQALIISLPTAAKQIKQPINVLHLAAATGREVPSIVQNISPKNYLLNDICPSVINRTGRQVQQKFPSVNFTIAVADIEKSGSIKELRQKLSGPTFFVLVANGVIFSNRQMDKNIFDAMQEEDLFLLTLETPHAGMYDSYLIPPVLKLISKGGVEVNINNVSCWFDEKLHTMNMACRGNTLLSSYKPTPDQLRQRMSASGFNEVVLQEYQKLHMIASLWRKK